MDSNYSDNAREDLLETLSDELERINAHLEEIEAEIGEYEDIVVEEQGKWQRLAGDLRLIDENVDTTPPEDIQGTYKAALDQARRFESMRSQLDRFKVDRAQHERERDLIDQVLSAIQGGISLASPGSRPAAGSTGVNIIRIVQAQEEERQRLARQMHDGPAQSLTNFVLQAEICQRLFERDQERAAEELDNLKTTANVTFQKVRDFIFDLRPMMLDDLGVVPTVRRFVENFKDKYDIDTRFEQTGEIPRLDTHREVILFRGIQRLMSYARDYAAPTKLEIRLDLAGDLIKSSVEDDGRGFDAEAAMMGEATESDPRASGIIGLKEELELVGGSLRINSNETEGTLVQFEIPAED